MKTNILTVVLLFISTLSFAGSQAHKQATFEPEKIVSFAKEVEKYAASQGARAFIIARVGRPEKDLPKGIHFTHTAVAVYSNIHLADGQKVQGYAIHNLYQVDGQPNKSQLLQDYPVDFFWGAQQLKAGIIIPSEEIQHRLIEIIATGKNQVLHNDNYSVIANPFNSRFQNCTEHTLDMINAAIYQTTDIKQLKTNTQAHFKAQRVKTNPFKLMMGAMLMDEVTTKDHKGKVVTTTFGSIHRYLQQYGLVQHSVNFYTDGKAITL